MSKWRKVDKKGAEHWLYELVGAHSSSYWIRYRREGINLQERIEGTFRSWPEAQRAGQKILASARGGISENRPLALTRTEELCSEIVNLAMGKSRATYEQTEIMFRKHITPWVNDNVPYAQSLNATHWERYKTQKRMANPSVALFNHWKYFVMLFNHATKRGLISPTRLEFNEDREDFRERGKVIPNHELLTIIQNANEVWRDRIIIQRKTGMRPGEVRKLRKDRVDFESAVIALRKEDTKNRKARSFGVDTEVLAILRKRAQKPNTEFFFPARGKPHQPMDRCLTGWESALTKSGLINKGYTPHDLRHSWCTEMFQTKLAPALICYIAGLSMDEAEKTYLHFKPEDTRIAASEVSALTNSLKIVRIDGAGNLVD